MVSKKRNAASKASKAPSAATAPAAAAPAAAPALPDLLGDEATITERLNELLDSIKARPILQRLRAQGYSDHVAQRACLEVHQAKRELSYDSCIKWIRRHDVTKIDKPLQPLELLKYLSEIVVSLVERLPKPDPSQLQRQLAADLRSTSTVLLAGSSANGSSGGPSGGSGDAMAAAASVAAAQGMLASLDIQIHPADASTAGGAGAVAVTTQQALDQAAATWKASLAEADDELLAKLAAAEAVDLDLEAMLRTMDLGATLGDVGAGSGDSGSSSSTAAPALLVGAPSTSAAPAVPAAQAPDTGSPAAGASSAAPSSSSASGGSGGGFMSGLQQQMSKAMQSLGLRRNSSSSSSSGGGSSSSGGKSGSTSGIAASGASSFAGSNNGSVASARSSSDAAEVHATAPVAAAGTDMNMQQAQQAPGEAPVSTSMPPAACSDAARQQQQQAVQAQSQAHRLSQQELSHGQLASLRAMLGPGVEVYTAEEFKQHNPGADYDSLPSIDLQLLQSQAQAAEGSKPSTDAATSATECADLSSAAAGGSGALDPQLLTAEVASLRQHREWADRRIAQLIKRVSDAERPVKEEAAKLLQEVQALRVEKEGMKAKLRELERSIGKIKESTYAEAQQKREYERQAAVAAAELKAANLREQEAASEVQVLQKQLQQERKRREGAEQRCKKSAADAAGAVAEAAAAAAAAAHEEVEVLRRQLRQQQQLAEERRAAAEHAEVAAAQARLAAEAAARGGLEVLAAEKASLMAALEETERRHREREQAAEEARAVLEAQLEATQQHAEQLEQAVQGLQRQLAAAHSEAAAVAQRAADAESRAAAAHAAAEAAKQQLTRLLQQQQQQSVRVPSSPQHGGPAAVGLEPHPPGPMAATAPAAAPPSAPGNGCSDSGSLFGPNFSVWGAGSLFGSGPLDASSLSSSAVPPAPPPPLSGSTGSSGSPLSQSGTATPQHSMHSSSIANSPVAPGPGSLGLGLGAGAMLGGGGSGVGAATGPSLYAVLPQQHQAAFSSNGTPFGVGGAGGGSGLLLPDPSGIWGTAATAGSHLYS